MERRQVLGLGFSAVSSMFFSGRVVAQPAHSNAGGNGHGNANGVAGGDGGGSENHGGGGGDSEGTGNGRDRSGNSGRAARAAGQQPAAENEIALDAVTRGAARPLAEIVESAKAHVAGEIIDATLVTVGGYLLYELKVLDGRQLRRVYYYAKSGLPVGDP